MKSLYRLFAATVLFAGVSAFAQQGQQQSFDSLKALAGSWTGSVDTDEDGKIPNINVTMRVTSMGNTLMHEMRVNGQPDDPITMFTIDGDRLVLTHYCDAGNQPHMVATVSPDGKTFTFDFVSATNLLPTQHGHMQHVVFKLIDADHHTEQWQFAMADGKTMGAVMDLHRAK
jgi:hypothetical protein